MLGKLWRRARKGGWPAVKHYLRFRRLQREKPAEVMSPYGVMLKGNWLDKTFGYYMQGSYGVYYAHHLSDINEPFVFIDIGANQGLYSLIAAANQHCKKVYAFEPIAKTAALFRENINLNPGVDIALHQLAIDSESSERSVLVDEHHTGKTSLRGQKRVEQGVPQTIQRVTHQQLNELIVPEPSLRVVIKIDVEGLEEKVMQELQQCRWFSQVSDIFYEVDENWLNTAAVEQALRQQGFQRWRKIGADARKKRRKHYDLHAWR